MGFVCGPLIIGAVELARKGNWRGKAWWWGGLFGLGDSRVFVWAGLSWGLVGFSELPSCADFSQKSVPEGRYFKRSLDKFLLVVIFLSLSVAGKTLKASAPKIESVEIFEAEFEDFSQIEEKLRNEANISTVEDSTKTPARVPKSEFESERAGNISQPPKKRPQAFDSRIILGFMPESKRFFFRPRQRILRAEEFDDLKESGQRVSSHIAIMNWRLSTERDYSRLGMVISKKQIGKRSVVRHRARRLLRESFRLLQNKISKPVDVVLVARKGINDCRQGEVERELMRMLRRAGVVEKTARKRS